ncbi:hypothetical protein [Alteromonas sp. a30]|uniref:hypothetical protein n=1 Tax=Alteromonas sp. a30 TaxID=2730917 RepID=UPI002282BE38|nr:hypothetical protein [Alteromonas sp. a30]MCY7295780.1 hypothetical protein [Alteromonas sp. a30]
MRARKQQTQEGFVSLHIHADTLKSLLANKFLFIEDIHCPDNVSKMRLKQLLLASVTPIRQA